MYGKSKKKGKSKKGGACNSEIPPAIIQAVRATHRRAAAHGDYIREHGVPVGTLEI